MVDPFSILLSAGVSWTTGKILDAILDCLRCNHDHTRGIQNREINYLSCPDCGNSLSQYINACDYTFDETTRTVGVADIANIWWKGSGGLFDPIDFEPHFSLWTLDLDGRDLVVRLELGELDFSGYPFYTQDMVFKSRYRHSTWEDNRFSVPESVFPDRNTTVTVDLKVLSEYNDLLARAPRRLMGYHY